MNVYAVAHRVQFMWEVVPENLQRAMDRAGVNQSQLAEKVGLKQPSIGRLLSGETKTSRSLDLIARALNTSSAFLRGETDEPGLSLAENRPLLDGFPVARDSDLVDVQEIDLKFGLGATELEVPVTINRRQFSREWLRQYTRANPDQLYFAQGIGDSMAPTILDSDLLLIDTSDTDMRMADKFWAISFYGQGMVKRLRQSRDGVRILSDNPAVPEEIATDGELHVLGRVVAIVRKL